MSEFPQDYDNPWKDILEAHFEDCLAFFFPDIHAEIDWRRGYECLNAELQQITRDAERGKRWADKLVKVWRNNGREAWVVIHTEIQGQPESQFPARMFVYNYRLSDRYNVPVVSLAILSDERPTWRPSAFDTELWGCATHFQFPTVKLLDYNQRWDELETSLNPFALVVMAHLQSQATRGQRAERKALKLRLTRQLFEHGYDRQAIANLYRFIDWVIRLPEDLEIEYRTELAQEERAMPYLSTIERIARQEGLEQGLERGLEQGLERGERRLVLRLLNQKLGAIAPTREARIADLSRERVEALSLALLDFQSWDDFDSWLGA